MWQITLVLAWLNVASCWGFTSRLRQPALVPKLNPAVAYSKSRSGVVSRRKTGLESSPSPDSETVFNALLRDLQIEDVPLLECDASSVETFMGGTFTTMAEMSMNNESSKACLVLQNIPMDAISAFADDFATLKLQPRLMEYLPEVGRFTVEVLGKGSGPALIIEALARTPEEIEEMTGRSEFEQIASEESATASIKSFVQRIVIAESACPFTKEVESAPAGLQAKGIPSSQVGYRYGGSSDALQALASFWTCVCELQGSQEQDLSTIILSLPSIGPGTDVEAHARFSTVMELVSRNLCLFRGDSMLGLVHFHPAYDRSVIIPVEAPSYGHLPPRTWLPAMMNMNGNKADAESMTEEQLALSDYQRRSPHTAINILRTSQINAAAGANSIVDLPLEDGTIVKASGITTYTRNAIRLAGIGKEVLDDALDEEVAMTWGI